TVAHLLLAKCQFRCSSSLRVNQSCKLLFLCLLSCCGSYCSPQWLFGLINTSFFTFLYSVCILYYFSPIDASSTRDSILRPDGYPTPGQVHPASTMLLGSQSVPCSSLSAPHHY